MEIPYEVSSIVNLSPTDERFEPIVEALTRLSVGYVNEEKDLEEEQTTPAKQEEFWRDFIPRSIIILAQDTLTNEYIGFGRASRRVNPMILDFQDAYVEPNHRRIGVLNAMTEKLEEESKGLGIQTITVEAVNDESARVLKRRGYRRRTLPGEMLMFGEHLIKNL